MKTSQAKNFQHLVIVKHHHLQHSNSAFSARHFFYYLGIKNMGKFPETVLLAKNCKAFICRRITKLKTLQWITHLLQFLERSHPTCRVLTGGYQLSFQNSYRQITGPQSHLQLWFPSSKFAKIYCLQGSMKKQWDQSHCTMLQLIHNSFLTILELENMVVVLQDSWLAAQLIRYTISKRSEPKKLCFQLQVTTPWSSQYYSAQAVFLKMTKEQLITGC